MKYIVHIEDQIYEVEIQDLRARPIRAIVDGVECLVYPETRPGQPSQKETQSQSTLSVSSHSPLTYAKPSRIDKNHAIRAPIPGVILEINVKPGDKVVYGQELCWIEAMKMKNAIRANREGTIAEILVNPGQSVNHGEVLMRFAE